MGGLWNKNPDRPLNPDKANNECDTQPDNSEVHGVALLKFYCQEIPINILFQLHMYHILSILKRFYMIKGGKANFSFRDFEPDFLHQYLLKY